jgi:hypothetical protein
MNAVSRKSAFRRLNAPGLVALALAFAAALCAAPVAARTCFIVYDAKDSVVYRDWKPPFEGVLDYDSPGREALRARGEHFVYFEAERCAPVSGAGLPGVGRPASIEEIVAGFPSYTRASTGISGTGGAAGGSAATGAAGGPASRITAPATAAMQTRAASYR